MKKIDKTNKNVKDDNADEELLVDYKKLLKLSKVDVLYKLKSSMNGIVVINCSI